MNRPFEAFFEANYADMVRTLTLALGNRTQAEDAAQEGFARALGRWRRVSEMSRPAAWVYVVALRSAWREPRGRARPTSFDTPAPANDPAPAASEPADVSVVERIVVAEAIDSLSPRQRLAVVLRFTADMTITEIAEAMGCAPGTVKATLHQALAKLRVSLAEDQLGEEVVHGAR